MTDTTILRYADERDKSYGLAGMAITLLVNEGREYLAHISLDGDADEAIEMTHDFFYRGNPRMSAKYVWASNVQHLRLAAAMILGNAVCRRCVLQGQYSLDRERTEVLKSVVREVARESCELVAEEADSIFHRELEQAHRLFSNVRVHGMADRFVDELRVRRSMSGGEAFELLQRFAN